MPVPAKGIEAFPLNFFINNMLTVLAVQNPSKCTNCEDSSQATARCLDCVENLCSNCVFAHKRIRQTKEHRILSFDEIQANEVKDIIRCPSFCSMHPREVSFSFLLCFCCCFALKVEVRLQGTLSCSMFESLSCSMFERYVCQGASMQMIGSLSSTELGPVSRKSRELFGPEKPVVKLQSNCFKNLTFLIVSSIGYSVIVIAGN